MKKRYTVWIIAALLTMILGACGGCNHEWQAASCEAPRTCSLCGETEGEAAGHSWQEPDCETPKTCTVCGETEGEALGHSWQEATCEMPQTCAVCAAAQGEPEPHRLGKWSVDGEQMTRGCKDCAFEEVTALDREVYFLGNTRGHWDTHGIMTSEGTVSAYSLRDSIGISLSIAEDGTIRYDNGGMVYTGTVRFKEYRQLDNSEYYHFEAVFSEDNVMKMALCGDGEEEFIRILFENYGFFLSDFPECTEGFAGVWSSMGEGSFKELCLNEDHTFTGNMDGEIRGTWHNRGIAEQGGNHYAEILLSCGDNPGRKIIRLRRYLSSEEGTPEELLADPAYFTIRDMSTNARLRRTTQEELDRYKIQMQEGISALLGNWTSQDVSVTDRATDSTQRSVLAGKTVTFSEDGIFRGILDQEMTGIWYYRSAMTPEGTEITYYDFELEPENGDGHWTASVYDGNLNISHFTDTEQIHYHFLPQQEEGQKDDAQKQVEQKLIGSWTSLVCNAYNNDTQTDSSYIKTDVSVTLREDGTLTVFMGEEKTGTWTFSDTILNGEGTEWEHTTYTYKLMITGEPEPWYLNYSDQEENFYILYIEDNYNNRLHFGQVTPEEVAKIEQGAEKILGTWTSTTVMETTEDFSGESKHIDTMKYSVTVHENGTFECDYYKKGQGTWSYVNYNAETGYEYTFRYEGDPEYSFMYTLREEELFGWDKSGDILLGLWMKKTAD